MWKRHRLSRSTLNWIIIIEFANAAVELLWSRVRYWIRLYCIWGLIDVGFDLKIYTTRQAKLYNVSVPLNLFRGDIFQNIYQSALAFKCDRKCCCKVVKCCWPPVANCVTGYSRNGVRPLGLSFNESFPTQVSTKVFLLSFMSEHTGFSTRLSYWLYKRWP